MNGAVLGRLAHDTRGVSLIEFAICLPFLILLFTGSFQLSDAVAANRKVTMAARTIADLTSQYTVVSDSDLDTILNASQQVLAPYSADAATMTVTLVTTDALARSTVAWSDGKNTNGLKPGTAFNLPLAIKQPGTSLIVAQVVYTYNPSFGATYIGTIPLTETIIMSPRGSSTITHS
ncbi:TadE/TadG family type IV pilus assembly protein [Sphingomonas sp. M1A8_2b]